MPLARSTYLEFTQTLLYGLCSLFLKPLPPFPARKRQNNHMPPSTFFLSSISLILFHESESSLHNHQQSQLKLLFSTTLQLFISSGPAFYLVQKPLEGWGRAPKPSLRLGFLAEMYFLLHIKVHWKHRNLSPSGVRYIYKYIHQIL